MGVVYLGFDPKISRQVAIKTLHYDQFDAAELPNIKERFFVRLLLLENCATPIL